MKLTSIEIHPENSSEVAILSFRDPRSTNPYNVTNITGLDADEIVAKFYGGSGSENFYALTLQKRQIVISVRLNPIFGSQSYSDLRDQIYRMVASSRSGRVQLQFKNGPDVIAAVSGFVAKLEAPHFEKTQTINITINCDEPMLKAPVALAVDVTGLDPTDTLIVDDLSTAPHGFTFDMTVTAAIASIIITDPGDPSWSFGVAPVGGFLTGDVLYFSSENDAKELYIVRGASTIQLADVIVPGSLWPIMFPGVNHFAFTHPANLTWNDVAYFPTYWGV